MNKLTEGKKMFISVMAIFVVYAVIFIIFDDFDRRKYKPIDGPNDWHLVIFSVVVMIMLAFVLHRYWREMDKRISREQDVQKTLMRRQLTQNISHELKTPVTSILGYMDTLIEHEDMPAEMRQQFIRRSQSQARRLTSLLQDLSTLNRMDYAQEAIEMEQEIDVAAIIKDVMMETQLAMRQKKMEMQARIPQKIIIKGNPSLVYSIFRNLTDNAINYAGQGTYITLTAREQPNRWLFVFTDNGVGVSEEHLDHLFERFYRVEKGRSRSMGGTGLGLAIVKNAIMLHGGTISVTNASGLRFDFSLMKG